MNFPDPHRHPTLAPPVSHPEPTRHAPRAFAPSVRLALLALALLAPAWAGGCDVEWSGARIGIEEPRGGPSAAEDSAEVEREPLPPLPRGPLLYYVRVTPSGGALAAPAARVGPDGTLRELALPDTMPGAWRARFDSAFYPSGRELALHSASRRAGSLVLSGSRSPDASCPPVAEGQVFVAPGAPVPDEALAMPGGTWAAEPGPGVRAEPDDRIRLFAPILAERLLGEEGVERAFLAQLVDLAAVPFPGSTRPGMAASYLIGDTLAPVPPGDSAVSLFYLARYSADQGYTPQWVRLHRYDAAGGKRAYGYVAAADGPGGRVHFLRLYDASSARLAALWPDSAGAPGEISWTADERCSPLELADRAAAAGEGDAAEGGDPDGGGGEPGGS